jgi:catechol 2,3-dioxygenase-like lactoylglutathione lyase family enzyme
MNPRLAVVSLWAEDVPATAHFSRDVIGLHLLSHHGARPHFDLDGIYLTILKGRPRSAQDADPSRFPVVAFAVESLDAAVARLRAHHIDLPSGIEGDEHTRWVMFLDPAGNLIELVEFGA